MILSSLIEKKEKELEGLKLLRDKIEIKTLDFSDEDAEKKVHEYEVISNALESILNPSHQLI